VRDDHSDADEASVDQGTDGDAAAVEVAAKLARLCLDGVLSASVALPGRGVPAPEPFGEVLIVLDVQHFDALGPIDLRNSSEFSRRSRGISRLAFTIAS